MNSTAWSRCAVGTLILFAPVGWNSIAQAQTVGRTPGVYAVSPSGAATYTIPIWSPPGPKGIQPHMSLVYNSQSGNEYVGVGWSLAGLSSIYRCNLTYAQDAAPAPVSLSTSDGYCLDGQRLRLTAGTYGEAGSTYQTEIANFENVTAYGSAGNGPGYFIVHAPDGHTYEYGNDSNGANSQVLASGQSTALTWMLDEVSDPAGNTMTISYCPIGTTGGSNCPSTALEGTTVPSTISWTPTSHGASTYAYTMTFTYGSNVLPPAGYAAGTPVQNPALLSSITVDYSASQVKQYVLTYQQSATSGRDLLTQIQECSTSAGTCLYPTTISYQGQSVSTAGVSTAPTVAVSAPISPCGSAPVGVGASITHYDFNGDGYTDLLYDDNGTCYVAFGSASGYGTPVSTGVSGAELSSSVLVGDLLGAGKAGILANNGGTWFYYTWSGSSFTATSTGLAYDSTAIQYALADINGDGLPDLVALYGPSTIKLTTRLNTSSSGTPSFSGSAVTTSPGGGALSVWLITPDTQFGNVKSFDFNGDGRQDLALQVVSCLTEYMGYCVTTEGAISELISQTDGTFSIAQIAQPPAPGSGVPPISFANLNNDACTDVVGYTVGIYVSACNSSTGATLSPQYPVVAVMDWNGDGLADLVENNGGTLYVQLSTGTGFGPATATSLTYNSNCTYVALDANGDGLDDLACLSSQSGAAGLSYYLHGGAAQPPDLLASITDGYGNSEKPSYVSMVQAVNDYYFPGGEATYPYQNYLVPMYLVANTTYSDPSNWESGTYLIWDYYSDARTNLQGRGFAGFGAYQTYDTRNGVYTTYNYGQDFPYTGMLESVSAATGLTA